MRAVWVLLCACGRVAFDPTSDGGTPSGDSQVADDTMDVPGDPTLLLHFSFESGLLVDDSGGNDASCTTCPALTTRPGGGQAVQFDGSTTCLSIPLPLAERPTMGFTAAAWIRLDANGTTQTMFGSPRDTVSPTQNAFEIYTASPNLTTMQINNGSSVSVPTPVSEWHHVALVWTGGTVRSFLDGAMFNSAAAATPLWTGENLTIGCDVDNAAGIDYFGGAADEVRLYSRALDTASIAALAQ